MSVPPPERASPLPQPARGSSEAALLPLRLGLVVLALFLLWLMDRRLLAAREEFAATFEPPLGTWLLFLLLGVLTGAAFGLSVTWPTRFGGYRWGRVAVVGALPLVALVLGTVFVLDISRIPAFLLEFTFVYAGGFQSVAAVMLGAALGSGFAEPRP